jgi:hypothetical protein
VGLDAQILGKFTTQLVEHLPSKQPPPPRVYPPTLGGREEHAFSVVQVPGGEYTRSSES